MVWRSFSTVFILKPTGLLHFNLFLVFNANLFILKIGCSKRFLEIKSFFAAVHSWLPAFGKLANAKCSPLKIYRFLQTCALQT